MIEKKDSVGGRRGWFISPYPATASTTQALEVSFTFLKKTPYMLELALH